MQLIFGIDDWDGELDYEELERPIVSPGGVSLHPFSLLKDIFYCRDSERWGDIVDFLYWGVFCQGDEKILGMQIQFAGYDSNLVRALSVFHPEYYVSGKKDIPVWDRDNHRMYAEQIYTIDENGLQHLPRCDNIEWQWSWLYPSVIEQHHMWLMHAYCTRYLLQQAGIDIDYKRFKAMLVWDWC